MIQRPKTGEKMGELLTTEETAAYLGVKPQSLAIWRLRGENLPFVKVGRLVRYRRSDVEKWIESRTVATKAV
jgi:excisionase family DNA binding protein